MEIKKVQVDFSSQDLRRLIIPLVIEQLLAITVGLLDSLNYSPWLKPGGSEEHWFNHRLLLSSSSR